MGFNKNKKKSVVQNQSIYHSIVGFLFVAIVAFVFYQWGYKSSKSDFELKNNLTKYIEVTKFETIPEKISITDKPQEANEKIIVGTVVKFYEAISTRQYRSAYDLFSKNYKKASQDYDGFRRGFDMTLSVNLKNVRIQDPLTNSVYVEIESSDKKGEKVLSRKFSGSWNLIYEEDGWKLDNSNIEVKQNV